MILEILTLTTLSLPAAPVTTAQVQPCVWPRICKIEVVETVAQVQPCVWPRVCKVDQEEKPITICSLPNKCA